jgi:atlastin
VKLNIKEKTAEVDEDALGRLEKRLRECGHSKVAVVSVMGAFRTGKSFLLDMFLRFLRFEEERGPAKVVDSPPPRSKATPFPLPDWMTSRGPKLDGVGDNSEGGFKAKGGMDAVTEGIWVWSEPFVRTVEEGGVKTKVALILMDTQGAWDGNMTKEQSATIFGLTAVLSSKQIYNINMQVQEDKVENLAFFMRFAQAALAKAAANQAQGGPKLSAESVSRPFQSLDFLVRDWKYFKPDWSFDQCRKQMKEHIDKFIDPERVVENSTAEALNSMFKHISCFCMPHPGFTIESEDWDGSLSDLDQDFVRCLDTYVREVFTTALDVKVILGQELSTLTFPIILRQFVAAFHDSAPQALSFNQAMTQASALLAKEQAMTIYTKAMEESMKKSKAGLSDAKFTEAQAEARKQVKELFDSTMVFGDGDQRKNTWKGIEDNIKVLHERYIEDNKRRLEQVLVPFANAALIAVSLFLFDRISDFTCDWWLQTCVDLSKLMFTCYVSIFLYVGVHVYFIGAESGKVQVALAGGEMWKEMMRLVTVYVDEAKKLNFAGVMELLQKAVLDSVRGLTGDKGLSDAGAPKGSSKKSD